jgi:predicted integral membrane protein DUF2269
MPVTTALVAAHVTCTTLGYGGLISANLWLALVARSREQAVMASALRATEIVVRIFGPLLGVGILFGAATMGAMRVPASSSWLVATYVVIVLALAVQVTIAIPWYRRTSRSLTSASPAAVAVDVRVPAFVAAAFAFSLALVVTLMVAKPSA